MGLSANEGPAPELVVISIGQGWQKVFTIHSCFRLQPGCGQKGRREVYQGDRLTDDLSVADQRRATSPGKVLPGEALYDPPTRADSPASIATFLRHHSSAGGGEEAGGGVGEAPGGVPAHDGEHLQHTRSRDVQKSGGAVSEYWKLHVV